MNADTAGPPQRPTIVRHFVVLVCMLMAVLLYLDRFCVSIAQPYIKQDLHLSTFQVGFFFSAFFLTYALFQVPSGWMTDRFGSRIMLAVYVLAWSFFTAMMGLSYGFLMLILMRAAYGLGQAGAYPTSASILSKWAPFSSRGTASSIVALGGRMGGAIAPLLTALLIVQFVPTSEPSLFERDDVLDSGKLCSKIAPHADADSKPDIDRVWGLLDGDARALFSDVATRYRTVEKQIEQLEKEGKSFQKQWRFAAARERFEAADKLRIDVSGEEQHALTATLNRVVRSDDFYRANDEAFEKPKLDRAAKTLASRVDRGESLSGEERQRLHRLLLEAMLPDSLGKVYVGGWRPVMIAYGLLGIVIAAFIWIVLRNRPEEHPRCNFAERTLIAAGRPMDAPSPHGKAGNVPWARLLKSGSMWMNCIAQVGTNIGWVFIVTWFPDYLDKVYDVKLEERGLMASVPLFVGWFGMLSGGKLTDFFVGRVGLKWGRRIPWGGSRFIGVAAFLCCPYLDSPWAATIAMSVVAFSTDLGTASGWAFCQDVGGRYVGSVLGWGNMWGNLGATVSPILLAWVIDNPAWGYERMFVVCAGAFVVSGVCGLMIDATKPIAPPDEAE
ncbi:MAG: MFS transporter [Planctomycetaceae bacterium]